MNSKVLDSINIKKKDGRICTYISQMTIFLNGQKVSYEDTEKYFKTVTPELIRISTGYFWLSEFSSKKN